jgi:hypothetical protein
MELLKQVFLISFLLVNTLLSSQSNLEWSRDLLVYNISPAGAVKPEVQIKSDSILLYFPSLTGTTPKSLTAVYCDFNGNIGRDIRSYKTDTLGNSIIDYRLDASGNLYLLKKKSTELPNQYTSSLQKFASNGSFQWEKTLAFQEDTSYSPRSLCLFNDTTVFVCIHKDFDFPVYGNDVFSDAPVPYIYSYSASGELNWKKRINIDKSIVFFNHRLYPLNKLAYLVGTSRFYDYSLISIDQNGEITEKRIDVRNGNMSVSYNQDNIFIREAFT